MTGRARQAAVLALASLLVPSIPPPMALAKPGTPGPAWFEGTYQRIGRSGGTPSLLDDRLRIVARGPQVGFVACDGALQAVMSFGPAFEVENLMSGQIAGGAPMDCLFNPDGAGRPQLTCRAADGAAFTLWAEGPGASDCAPGVE